MPLPFYLRKYHSIYWIGSNTDNSLPQTCLSCLTSVSNYWALFKKVSYSVFFRGKIYFVWLGPSLDGIWHTIRPHVTSSLWEPVTRYTGLTSSRWENSRFYLTQEVFRTELEISQILFVNFFYSIVVYYNISEFKRSYSTPPPTKNLFFF